VSRSTASKPAIVERSDLFNSLDSISEDGDKFVFVIEIEHFVPDLRVGSFAIDVILVNILVAIPQRKVVRQIYIDEKLGHQTDRMT
jgi:hypothetical protein